jgi:hypothetical protein
MPIRGVAAIATDVVAGSTWNGGWSSGVVIVP